jgi:hypothetical protein
MLLVSGCFLVSKAELQEALDQLPDPLLIQSVEPAYVLAEESASVQLVGSGLQGSFEVTLAEEALAIVAQEEPESLEVLVEPVVIGGRVEVQELVLERTFDGERIATPLLRSQDATGKIGLVLVVESTEAGMEAQLGMLGDSDYALAPEQGCIADFMPESLPTAIEGGEAVLLNPQSGLALELSGEGVLTGTSNLSLGSGLSELYIRLDSWPELVAPELIELPPPVVWLSPFELTSTGTVLSWMAGDPEDSVIVVLDHTVCSFPDTGAAFLTEDDLRGQTTLLKIGRLKRRTSTLPWDSSSALGLALVWTELSSE